MTQIMIWIWNVSGLLMERRPVTISIKSVLENMSCLCPPQPPHTGPLSCYLIHNNWEARDTSHHPEQGSLTLSRDLQLFCSFPRGGDLFTSIVFSGQTKDMKYTALGNNIKMTGNYYAAGLSGTTHCTLYWQQQITRIQPSSSANQSRVRGSVDQSEAGKWAGACAVRLKLGVWPRPWTN